MFTFQSFTGNKMDELVFENRNKAYGAYVLRSSYNDTMFKSLLYALGLVVLFLGTGAIISKLSPTEMIVKKKKNFKEKTTEILLYKEKDRSENPVKEKQQRNVLPPKAKTERIVENTTPIVKDKVDDKKDIVKDVLKTNLAVNDSAASSIGENDKKGTIIVAGSEGKKNAAVEAWQVDKNPEFPGGEQALRKFLTSNLRYPELARDNNTQGTVHIQFIVDIDGNVSDVKIVRAIGDGCGEEAVRVVNKMPKWSPGIFNKEPVKVIYRLPVKFVMQ